MLFYTLFTHKKGCPAFKGRGRQPLRPPRQPPFRSPRSDLKTEEGVGWVSALKDPSSSRLHSGLCFIHGQSNSSPNGARSRKGGNKTQPMTTTTQNNDSSSSNRQQHDTAATVIKRNDNHGGTGGSVSAGAVGQLRLEARGVGGRDYRGSPRRVEQHVVLDRRVVGILRLTAGEDQASMGEQHGNGDRAGV